MVLDAERQLLQTDLISQNTCISACAKAAQWQCALQVLADLEVRDLLPDVITYSAAISSLESEWELALHLLRGQTKSGKANVITYNSAITSFGVSSQWCLAFELMAEMASDNVWPSIVTHNAAIAACATWLRLGPLVLLLLFWGLPYYIHSFRYPETLF